MVTLLLADDRVDPNTAEPVLGTALIFAALKGHASVITLLLADERVDPNRAGQNGDTALIFAASKGHASVVTLLLADERVDPNMAGQNGNTALIEAVHHEYEVIVDLLLADKRLDPNIANHRNQTALSKAVCSEDTSLLELLLADHRTARTRPAADQPTEDPGRYRIRFDAALRAVKKRRNARFRGLTRAVVAFRRMRLRAALTVYAPGGAGFAAAAASFNAAAVGMVVN